MPAVTAMMDVMQLTKDRQLVIAVSCNSSEVDSGRGSVNCLLPVQLEVKAGTGTEPVSRKPASPIAMVTTQADGTWP